MASKPSGLASLKTDTEMKEEKERFKKMLKMPKILGEENIIRLK